MTTEPSFYEYKQIPSFARPYLDTYYSCNPSEDEREISKFMIEELRRLSRKFDQYIELGCGGTLHHSIPIAPWVDSIVLTDYLHDAREEVELWRTAHPSAFSWDHYISKSLEHEGVATDSHAIAERRNQIQSKIISIESCDVRRMPAVSCEFGCNSVWGMFFVAAEVGGDLEGWAEVMRCVAETIPRGGHLFMSALRGMSEYVLKSADGSDFRHIKCAAVDESHYMDLLPKLGFANPSVKAHLIANPDVHIPGVVMVSATKSGA
jgi:hypothetical protein